MMQTADKEVNETAPDIAILMAIYEPRMDWLKEQLDSLEAQTYPNLKLYIRDDCSPTVQFADIERLVRERIKTIPFELRRNERNLGSNRCFELLTREAQADFYSYCDQDDIWIPEKTDELMKCLRSSGAGLVCSDVIPIDADGARLADSITQLRPRHRFLSGTDLTKALVYRNFVIGCTMLIRSEIADSALPFADSMVHDHYLAFVSSIDHAIAVAPRPLLYYRLHKTNQTGVLANISSKDDYYKKHLIPFCQRLDELEERFPGTVPGDAQRWAEARKAHWKGENGSARLLFSLRHINMSTTLFELTVRALPDPLFRLAVRVIRTGKI